MKKIIEKSNQFYTRLCIMLSTLMLTAIPAPVLAASVGFVKTSANKAQAYCLSIAFILLVLVIVFDGYQLFAGGEAGKEKVKKLVVPQVAGLALIAFAPQIVTILKDVFGIA